MKRLLALCAGAIILGAASQAQAATIRYDFEATIFLIQAVGPAKVTMGQTVTGYVTVFDPVDADPRPEVDHYDFIADAKISIFPFVKDLGSITLSTLGGLENAAFQAIGTSGTQLATFSAFVAGPLGGLLSGLADGELPLGEIDLDAFTVAELYINYDQGAAGIDFYVGELTRLTGTGVSEPATLALLGLTLAFAAATRVRRGKVTV